MENSNNLGLPLLIPNQSGKEITHNEALIILDNLINNGVIDKDLTTPPENPVQNDLYIVKSGATGAWIGKNNQLAYYDNGWRFNKPRKGTLYWVNDESCFYIFNGTTWTAFVGGNGGGSGGGVTAFSELTDVILNSLTSDDIIKFNGSEFINSKDLQNLSMLGVNCNSDTDNKLMVKSDYVLFDNIGTSSRVKVNKALSNNVASHLFQNNYGGRAEFGLIGDDNFTLKVSEDGSNWNNSFVVDKSNGNIDFKGNITLNGENIGSGGTTGNFVPMPTMTSGSPGEIVQFDQTGRSKILPSGGSWFWILQGYASNGTVYGPMFSGVAAGSATIACDPAATFGMGFAWRVQ